MKVNSVCRVKKLIYRAKHFPAVMITTYYGDLDINILLSEFCRAYGSNLRSTDFWIKYCRWEQQSGQLCLVVNYDIRWNPPGALFPNIFIFPTLKKPIGIRYEI
jgi:hypothetical protein